MTSVHYLVIHCTAVNIQMQLLHTEFIKLNINMEHIERRPIV
jgi:hypothetical protein